MPKINIGTDYSGVDAAEGFSDYAGPTPPKGLYRTVVSKWWLVKNKNDDPMFRVILEIAEPKGSEKHRYNGYAIWHNVNLTAKSAPFANAFFDALGVARKAVWTGGIVVSQKDDTVVGKIGDKKIAGLSVKVNTRRKEYPVGSGDYKLEGASFLPDTAKALSDDDGDEGFSDSDDEAVSNESDTPDDPATGASEPESEPDDDEF